MEESSDNASTRPASQHGAERTLTKDSKARTKIQARIDRLENGNPGDVGPIGEGLSELRIDFGPGYPVYCGRAGKTLYLPFCGGDKATQDAGIKSAHAMWKVLNPPTK